MRLNESFAGFTLVEVLIVLELSFFLLLLPVLTLHSQQEKLARTLFYQQFEERLLHVQQVAIVQNRTTRVHVEKETREVQFLYPDPRGKPREEKLEIPAKIRAKKSWLMVFRPVSGEQGTPDEQFRSFVFVDEFRQVEVKYQFQMRGGKFVRTEKAL